MTYRRTALVADGSAEMRKIYHEVLGSLGFLTIEAEDGFQLLDRLRKVRPSLVIAELELRGLDGTEVLHFIRRNHDWMDIPVLITSARADDWTRRLVRQCGGTALVGKPIAFQTLRDVVRAVLLVERPNASVESDWENPTPVHGPSI